MVMAGAPENIAFARHLASSADAALRLVSDATRRLVAKYGASSARLRWLCWAKCLTTREVRTRLRHHRLQCLALSRGMKLTSKVDAAAATLFDCC